MAIVCNNSGEYLRRTTSLPARTAYTITAWVRVNSILGGASQFYFNLENATTNAGYQHGLGYGSNGVFTVLTHGTRNDFTSSPAAGAWYHMFLRSDSSGNIAAGFRSASAATYTTRTLTENSGFTSALLQFGEGSWGEYGDATYAAIKVWDATLTDAEIEQEWRQICPAKTASLNLWVPGIWTGTDRVKDLSGNARDFTAGGTLTDSDGPPVPWGAAPIYVQKEAGGGGVTQALTGSASTSSAGTLYPSHSSELTGQLATAAAGTIAPSHSHAIAGSAVTASAGTLVGSKIIALTGQEVTSAAGTLAPSHSQALIGQAVTAAAGTITYTAGVAVALTGQAVAASAGTLSAEHTNALSGQAATAAAGTIIYSGSTGVNVALTGQAVTASAGTLVPSHTQALTGQAATAAAGTISYTSATVLNLALTGQAVTASAGTLTNSATVALAGQAATAEAGALTPSHTQALTGSSISASAGSLTYVPGITIALTGQTVTATAGSLSPGAALLLAGSDIVVSAGTITISGTEPVLRYAPDAHTIFGAARVRLLSGPARVRTYLGTN